MATTMQPEIPWNVAGIAPEAREAARTSARREGLSVGEWLTRRILRGLPEPGAAAEQWWLAENGRTPSNENPIRNGHHESDGGMRSVIHHPVESGHQNQSRSAPGDAVAEIRLPARNSSENAEQLTERIVRLDARIARAEIRAAAEEAKHGDTIKALQAKVTVLTQQLSRTATRSASQDVQLAKAIEAVTEKFVQSQGEAADQRSTINARIDTIAEDNGAMNARVAALAEDTASIGEKLTESRDEGDRQLRSVENRVAATEIAVEAVRRDAGELDRLGGSLDQLTRRFEAADAEYLNNVERFEGRLTRIEANPGEAIIDRRLQGIEQALADMAKLIERNTPEKPATIGAPQRPEPADPTAVFGQSRDVRPQEPTFEAATPILDLPPFPEKPKSSIAPTDSTAASPAPDLRAAVNSGPVEPARRNAGNSSLPRDAQFSWVDPAGEKQTEPTHTRLILLGGLVVLVLAAVGMGIYLSATHAPGVSHIAAEPAHYTTVKAQQPVHAQARRPAQMARASASPAKQAGVAPSASLAPLQTAGDSHSHAEAVQRRSVPTAPAIQKSATAASAKPIAQLQRLAALAHAGHAKAQEVLGLAYLDGDGVAVNEAQGAKWLQRAAAGGEAVAAYRLGTLYERGHGVAADRAKAAQWYAVAAKAGNRKAMHNLAVAYAQGWGVRKDLVLAAQWFSRAASLGLADSQFNLGVLYERGMGVPQSLPEAYKWYAIAAAQGDAESRSRMEVIASQLRPAAKAAADKSAAKFHPGLLDGSANKPPIAASLVGGA